MMLLTTMVIASMTFLFLAFALYQYAKQRRIQEDLEAKQETAWPGAASTGEILLADLAPHLQQKKQEEELAVALAMAMAEKRAWQIAREVADQRPRHGAGARISA